MERKRVIPLFVLLCMLLLLPSLANAARICISRKAATEYRSCAQEYRWMYLYAHKYVRNIKGKTLKISIDPTKDKIGGISHAFNRLVGMSQGTKCKYIFYMFCLKNRGKVGAYLVRINKFRISGQKFTKRLGSAAVVKKYYSFSSGWKNARGFWMTAVNRGHASWKGKKRRRRVRRKRKRRRRRRIARKLKIIGKSCQRHLDCGSESTYQCLENKCALLKCDVDDNCAKDKFCSNNKCIPQAPHGTKCVRNRECASGRCIDEICRSSDYVVQRKLGDNCQNTNQCVSGLICLEQCRKPHGQACKGPKDCVSGYCLVTQSGATEGTCTALSEGRSCKATIQCKNPLICSQGTCQRRSELVEPGGSCDKDSECAGRAVCINKECKLHVGERCKGILDCVTGRCTKEKSEEYQTCKPFKKDEACVLDLQCAKGLKCTNKICTDQSANTKPVKMAKPGFEFGILPVGFIFQADQYRRFAGGVTLSFGVHSMWNRLGIAAEIGFFGNANYGPFHFVLNLQANVMLFEVGVFSLDLFAGYKGWFRGFQPARFQALTSGHFFVIGPRFRFRVNRMVSIVARFAPGFGVLAFSRYTSGSVVTLNPDIGVLLRF